MCVNFEMGATIWDTNSQMDVQGKINLHKQTTKQVKLTKCAMTWKGAITFSFTLHLVVMVASK